MPFFNHYILENPPPPNEDFDYTAFPLPEHFLWPFSQKVVGPPPIEINYNLIHKAFFIDEKSEEELNAAQDQIQQDESNVQKENNIQMQSNVKLEINNPIESSILENNVEIENFSNISIKEEIIEIDQDEALETNIYLEKSGKKIHRKKKKEKHKGRKHHKRHSHKVKERQNFESNEDSNSRSSNKNTCDTSSITEFHVAIEKHSIKSEHKNDDSSDDERHSSKRYEKKKDVTLSGDERSVPKRYQQSEVCLSSDEERHNSRRSKKRHHRRRSGKGYLSSNEERRDSRRSEKIKDYTSSDEEKHHSRRSEKEKDYLSSEDEISHSKRSEKQKVYLLSDEERHHRKSELKKKYSSSGDETHSKRSGKGKDYLSSGDERHSKKSGKERDYSSSGDERHYFRKAGKKYSSEDENSHSRISKDFVKRENYYADGNSRELRRNSDSDSHYRSPQRSPRRERYYDYERSRSPEHYDSEYYSDEEIEDECGADDSSSTGIFYCDICQLHLNSQATLQSHLNGKRHLKAQKGRSVSDIAKSSLVPVINIAEDFNRPDKSLPPPGMERIELYDEVSSIQSICDSVENDLIVLENVWEIRSPTETTYYCQLCDAPCAPVSIMPHLLGFKHQLRCVKQINPYVYERIKDLNKRRAEFVYAKEFFHYRKVYGKGRVKVFLDRPVLGSGCDALPFDQPGPSWRKVTQTPAQLSKKILASQSAPKFFNVSKPEDCLDTSAGDYRCIICDCHMISVTAWESHITGRRHLKKVKKCPQGPVINNKFVEAPPGTISHLEQMLDDNDPPGVIFGLQYIRENRGEMGDQYNCFPCGSCCSTLDIMTHITSIRHKMKSLETMYSEGKVNDIMAIKALQVTEYFKETLVDEECCKVLEKHGAGRPIVYIAKDPITGKPIQKL